MPWEEELPDDPRSPTDQWSFVTIDLHPLEHPLSTDDFLKVQRVVALGNVLETSGDTRAHQ